MLSTEKEIQMSTSTTLELVVVIGAGSMGQAIARRIGVGMMILLADLREDAAQAAAKTLQTAGFSTSTATVDVASNDSVAALAKTANHLGSVVHVVHTAGLSPAPGLTGSNHRRRPDRRGIRPGRVRPHHRQRWVGDRDRQPGRSHAPSAACRAERGAGHDLLIDGGVIASITAGRYQLNMG